MSPGAGTGGGAGGEIVEARLLLARQLDALFSARDWTEERDRLLLDELERIDPSGRHAHRAVAAIRAEMPEGYRNPDHKRIADRCKILVADAKPKGAAAPGMGSFLDPSPVPAEELERVRALRRWGAALPDEEFARLRAAAAQRCLREFDRRHLESRASKDSAWLLSEMRAVHDQEQRSRPGSLFATEEGSPQRAAEGTEKKTQRRVG